MESALADPGGGRRWVIYDEAWRVMRHLALLERMQAQWKLSRGLGIANLMVIHRLSDLLTAGDAGSRGRALAEGLLADCSTRIIYRQEADQLSRHPGLGVTATNPRHLPVIDLLLHRVGFTHLPDQGLYALTDPAREPTRRTQQALRALRGTALTVTAPDFEDRKSVV